MTASWILPLILAYVVVLFAVAWYADRPGAHFEHPRRRAIYYSLSLAALCSSWTYFAAIGLAAEGSILYLANFIGPIIAISVLHPLWRRIATLSKQENVGSIADFLSARYGKSQALGSLVACVAIIGALPYITLQFISLTKAWSFAAGVRQPPVFAAPVLVLSLAALAILFGARRPSLTQHGRGLTRMIAVESSVKLSALLAVAALSLWLVLGQGHPAPVPTKAPAAPSFAISLLTATLICTITAFTLPRQFHLGFVALRHLNDLKTARWFTPIYMGLWPLAITAIALAARAGFVRGGVDRDMIVLALPLAHGGPTLSAIAFLGGFSAGAAMVVIETVALSAMISNDLILPLLARTGWHPQRAADAGKVIVRVRQATIVAIHLLAWLCYASLTQFGGLTKLGFISLTASAQLFPALAGAVLWRRGHVTGAIGGISTGMAVWLLASAGPELAGTTGEALLATLGLPQGSGFEVGIVASFAVNILTYVGLSLRATPRLIDTIQATTFVASESGAFPVSRPPFSASVQDLQTLVARFVGQDEADRTFKEMLRSNPALAGGGDRVTPMLARSAERMLSGVIGTSSARNVITLCLAADTRGANEISQILDEAAHAVHFSRDLLHTTLEGLDYGVAVADPQHRLIMWNQRFAALVQSPRTVLNIGAELSVLLGGTDRFGNIDRYVRAMTAGEAYVGEHEIAGGIVLKIVGTPLVGSDYLTSIADVTEVHDAARALTNLNAALEERVAHRTQELTRVNAALADANILAERATRAQRLFVAAASHDLMQPLHAARLFLGSAADDLRKRPAIRNLIDKADISLGAADRLLRALLNLSRLEIGGLEPSIGPVDVGALLAELHQEFEPMARARGLDLVIAPTGRWVQSDPDLLRSVLQNLIANAIRYTAAGRVLIACRRQGDHVRFEVRDSGIGIAPEQATSIFAEFSRLGADADVPGSGLGLSIAERICTALGYRIGVRSAPGQGSTFSVAVPAAAVGSVVGAVPMAGLSLTGLSILCVENEPDVLAAMIDILERWRADVTAVGTAEDIAIPLRRWDVAIVDYHLGGGENGLDLLLRLEPAPRARLLVTAITDEAVMRRASLAGIVVLRKPLAPAVLRAVLAQIAPAVAPLVATPLVATPLGSINRGSERNARRPAPECGSVPPACGTARLDATSPSLR